MQFDWNNIFVSDLTLSFALEIILRTLLMFIVALAFLRLSGKKGIRQLSIFEVAIIISLGSAVGDPMFNDQSAVMPSVIVVITILLFYRFITWLMSKNERFESLLEGDPQYIIEDGMFVLSEANKHTFAKDEFMAEMRQQSIEHLGQVKIAILESNGTVSFFYYGDEEVKPGLPVLPKPLSHVVKEVEDKSHYACSYCGHVEELNKTQNCNRCQHNEWVKAIQTARIS